MALIPPFFLDCVVAIGLLASDGTKRWVASGFLYGDLIEPVTGTEKHYRVSLVTNRHVFEGLEKAYVRFNPEADEPAREYEIELRKPDGKLLWSAHPDPEIDVAVVIINTDFLKKEKINVAFFLGDANVADRAKANELGLSEGDGVYVLGFPLGLVGRGRNFVIVREGSIARIRDTLAGSNKEFLVDAFVFPGNSGGPVVTRPELTSIQGTKSQNAAYLIGMVKGFVSYREVAISEQTKRTRIVFEENSGLTEVVPIDFVKETIQEHLKTLKKD